MGEEGEFTVSRDWKERLSVSRDLGTGFAAPGGEFTRALYEWSLTPGGIFLQSLLAGRRVVELGAGMMPYGYALAASCEARNFVAVEPFYADKQKASIQAMIEDAGQTMPRIPYKVEGRDMLEYLKDEADDLLCVVACGIEDCILPGAEYRKKVEGEIYRVLEKDAFFLSSHSDLQPQGLRTVEMTFRRPSNPKVEDRLRLHGRKEAFDKYGEFLSLGTQPLGL
ncbi:MAG TPA: hypothetical protein DCF87_09950 [Opitutae bacterium]|nr:hypothetical protein [Opitutae bacterium]